MPCAFGEGTAGNAEFDSESSVGRRLNELHRLFDRKMRTSGSLPNSLNDIRNAIFLGAVITVENGFHARNTVIARSAVDGLIAFTWGNEWTKPKDGGTLDTWKKSMSPCKVHVPLGWLEQATDESMGEVLENLTRLKRKRLTIQLFFQQSEVRCCAVESKDNADEQVESSSTSKKTIETSQALNGTGFG